MHYKFSPRAQAVSVILLLFTMSGCSLMQPPVTADPALHKSLYNFPLVWTMSGRISVISGKENWYAKFNWIQEKEDFQISFTGPFGETELQLSQTAQKIVLKTPSSELTSDNLEELLLQQTGWKFPVTSLRYWSYGAPNPDMPAKAKYNEQQQISELNQLGWHIQYPKRMTVGEYLLPKKIVVTEQDIKIKIVVTKWDFPL